MASSVLHRLNPQQAALSHPSTMEVPDDSNPYSLASSTVSSEGDILDTLAVPVEEQTRPDTPGKLILNDAQFDVSFNQSAFDWLLDWPISCYFHLMLSIFGILILLYFEVIIFFLTFWICFVSKFTMWIFLFQMNFFTCRKILTNTRPPPPICLPPWTQLCLWPASWAWNWKRTRPVVKIHERETRLCGIHWIIPLQRRRRCCLRQHHHPATLPCRIYPLLAVENEKICGWVFAARRTRNWSATMSCPRIRGVLVSGCDTSAFVGLVDWLIDDLAGTFKSFQYLCCFMCLIDDLQRFSIFALNFIIGTLVN